LCTTFISTNTRYKKEEEGRRRARKRKKGGFTFYATFVSQIQGIRKSSGEEEKRRSFYFFNIGIKWRARKREREQGGERGWIEGIKGGGGAHLEVRTITKPDTRVKQKGKKGCQKFGRMHHDVCTFARRYTTKREKI
jgi:hypothetical protein